jgi:hypothetical protein
MGQFLSVTILSLFRASSIAGNAFTSATEGGAL